MGYPEAAIRTGKLSVNLETRIVSVDDQPVHLTGKEYLIFEFLSLRKGTIVTKEMLFNHVYRDMGEPEFKIMDVFICKLRKKLARRAGRSSSRGVSGISVWRWTALSTRFRR
jgi:two-component system cell cycle response regulator CtrA